MIGAKKPLVQILQETGCLLIGNNQPAERLQRVIIDNPATAGEKYPQSYVEALQISPKAAPRTERATFSRDAGIRSDNGHGRVSDTFSKRPNRVLAVQCVVVQSVRSLKEAEIALGFLVEPEEVPSPAFPGSWGPEEVSGLTLSVRTKTLKVQGHKVLDGRIQSLAAAHALPNSQASSRATWHDRSFSPLYQPAR
jgi:hypothetical protein